MRFAHSPLLPIGLLAAVLAVGCEGEEPIRTYKAPKPAAAAETAAGQYRILGAMFPADDPVWFFKVSGKSDELAPFAADFEKLIQSVRFPNGVKNEPVWTLPAGWTRGGANPKRMAADTIKFGPFEMTVSQAGGNRDDNVKRWVGQVGQPFDPAAPAKHTREVATNSVKGVLVDVTGPQNPAAGGGPFMGGR